jgi:dienelactone hydrolase
LGRRFGHGKKGKRRQRWLEEGGDPDKQACDVSDGMERRRARASQAVGWARPKWRRGVKRERDGLTGYCWAGPIPRREMKILFFFFSNFPKHFQMKF